MCEHNSTKRLYSHFGDELSSKQRIEEQRQTPNLFCRNRRKDSAPPRVSVVEGFTPVPRGRVRHPPQLGVTCHTPPGAAGTALPVRAV